MYKKEDLKFLNMEMRNKYVSNANLKSGIYKIYEIEDELSIEEKVKFIDELKDGIASYMLDILNKWEAEKDSLPKDKWEAIKTVSKKAWIKRNDPRKIIDVDYKIGKYYLFGTQYKTMSLICPTTEYGHNEAYTNDNIVNQWFHDLCDNLRNEEKKYFDSIDPVQVKISQLQKYAERYRIYFDSDKVNDIVWNRDEDVTEKELDIYLDAYKKIEENINNITKDVQNKLKEMESVL